MRGQVTEIYKVYDSPNRELIIPVYQRNYDWQQAQCAQLLDDLVELARTDRSKHFFGSLVGDQEDAWKWVVIDGQQRLTTVSLLILALSRLIDEEALKATDPSLGERLRSSYLLAAGDDTKPRFRLKPVKDDAEAYKRLFSDEAEFIESSNITANYRFFMEQLPRTGLTADELWGAICGLEVMWLDLEKDDDPQRIFESLNSTGLELTEADKVRNLVLMGLPTREQERVYEEYWNRIEKNVEYETDAFLRWYLVTKTSRTPRQDGVYDAFKVFAKRVNRQGAELLAEVRDYSVYYRELLTAQTGVAAADRRLHRLNILKQDVVLPLFMPLLGEVRAGTVSDSDFAHSIEVVDSYLVRRFVCGYATNALNKIFATIYKDVVKIRRSGDQFSDVLAHSLTRRTGSGYFPEDERFRDGFIARDFYNITPRRRRHLFECLENGRSNDVRDIASSMEKGDISVEHIMPQSLTAEWRAMLGDDGERVHHDWLHRIGNLTVTGYNSVYSNQPFNVKKETADGFLASPYRLNRDVIEAEQWTETEMQKRASKLANIALQYWSYPESSFEPPQVELPSEPMGDTETFTNRDVVAYEFLQGQHTVSSWKELVLNVLQECAVYDRTGLIAAAQNDPYWFRIDGKFAGQASKFEEVIPGLEVTLNTSTRERVWMLRRIFESLELDTDDLVLKFRREESDADEPTHRTSPVNGRFENLTKFIPVMEPLVGLQVDPGETEELVAELVVAIRDVQVTDPAQVLGQPFAVFTGDPTNILRASSEEILALLSLTLRQTEVFDPTAMHRAIVDGLLLDWLRRLNHLEAAATLEN